LAIVDWRLPIEGLPIEGLPIEELPIGDWRSTDCRLSTGGLDWRPNRQPTIPIQSAIVNPSIANRQSAIPRSAIANRQSAMS